MDIQGAVDLHEDSGRIGTAPETLAGARVAMAQAVEHARAGQHAAAQDVARTLAAEFPQDVNLLHQAGVVFQFGGAYDEALRQFHAALALQPDSHFTEMEVGNTMLALQRPEDALIWFVKAAQSAPGYALAHRRAAELLSVLGRPAQALELMEQANAADPADPVVAAQLDDLLVFHNRRDAAVGVYDALAQAGRLRPGDYARYLTLLTETAQYKRVTEVAARVPDDIDPGTAYHAAVLSGHARLALGLNRPALIAAARQREASGRWLPMPALIAELRAAIAAGRPLSVIRMSDGEARFLAYCDPQLRARLSAVEAECLGDVPYRNWFGQPVATADKAELTRLHAAVITAVERTDILGITTAHRLEIDHLHAGYLGHMEALLSSIAATTPAMRLADWFLHVDLHRASAFYRDILAGLDFLGVISPHPGLARRLAAHHGIARHSEYLLPGESRLPAARQNRQGCPHFPDVYRELCDTLAVPRPGAVFLVAGGLLAKVYCRVIRERGGIAIDAGSIVDAWMGLNTRPGLFDQPHDWLLPDAG